MYGAIAFTLYFSAFAKFIFAKAYLKFAKAKTFFAKAKLQEKYQGDSTPATHISLKHKKIDTRWHECMQYRRILWFWANLESFYSKIPLSFHSDNQKKEALHVHFTLCSRNFYSTQHPVLTNALTSY